MNWRAFVAAELADTWAWVLFWARSVAVFMILGVPLLMLGAEPERLLLVALPPYVLALLLRSGQRLARDLDWVNADELLLILVKLEEAAILIDGALQAYVSALKATGAEPRGADGERELARLGRGLEVLRELHGVSGRTGWALLGRMLLLGWSHFMRFAQGFTALQKLSELTQEAMHLVRRGGGSGPGGGLDQVAQAQSLARKASPIPAAIAALVAAERNAAQTQTAARGF